VDGLPKISFCLTQDELDIVAEVQRRLAVGGRNSNRSEVLRIAIAQLGRITDQELLEAGTQMTRLAPGRKPKASKRTSGHIGSVRTHRSDLALSAKVLQRADDLAE
jgi:hypothetical protein